MFGTRWNMLHTPRRAGVLVVVAAIAVLMLVAPGCSGDGGQSIQGGEGFDSPVLSSVPTGFIEQDGLTFYFDSTGTVQRDGIVGSEAHGYAYADAFGVVDLTYRGAVEQDGERWLVLDGSAHRVASDYDNTLWLAFKELETCTDPSMTKEQKLQAAFAHIRDDFEEYNPRIPHSHDPGWETLYANDIFEDRGGNCISCAAAFAFMAKAIGYDNVYACNTGHAWVEIDGLIYDPEWARYTSTGMSYFGQSYDNQGDQAYLRRGAASAEPGMFVAI